MLEYLIMSYHGFAAAYEQLRGALDGVIDLHVWTVVEAEPKPGELPVLAMVVPTFPSEPKPDINPHSCHGRTEYSGVMSSEEAAARLAIHYAAFDSEVLGPATLI